MFSALEAENLHKQDTNDNREENFGSESDYTYTLSYEEREDVRIRKVETETLLKVQELVNKFSHTNDIESFKEELEKIDHDEEHETTFFQGFANIFYKTVIKELTGSNILLYKKNAIFPFSSFEIATLNEFHPQSFGGLIQFASSIWEKIHHSYFPDSPMERHQSKFDRTLLGPVYIVDKNTLFIVTSMMIFTSFDRVLLLNIEKEEFVNRIIKKFIRLDDYNKKYVLWYLDYLRQYNLYEKKNGLDYKDLPISKQIVIDVMKRLLVIKSKIKQTCHYFLKDEWQLALWYDGYTDYYEQFKKTDPDSECMDFFSKN